MAQYSFGTGNLFIIPSGSNPTPIQVGVLKDVSLDISFTTKELRGAYQFPVDVARAGGKIAGKAKTGQISGALINSMLTGATSSAGTVKGVTAEAGTVGSSPYTVTVANSANFTTDLGVYHVESGKYLTRVASGDTPVAGVSYKVTSGVYTFAAGDTGKAVQISYAYTASASGQTNSLSNALMGSGTTFVLHVYNTFKGKDMGIKLYAVTFSKFALGFKNEDYTDQDLDFDAFADANGKVIDIYTAE